MNEKIRELMVNSGFATGYDRTQTGRWILSDKELEKFAELIVAECIDIVKPTDHHEVWAQSYLGGVDGLELLEDKCNKIKQHFGIEL